MKNDSALRMEVAKIKVERDAAFAPMECGHPAACRSYIPGPSGNEPLPDNWPKPCLACRWGDASFVRGLERAQEACIPWLLCKCDDAYTSRGRHEPNAWHELAEEIHAAIQVEIDKAKAI